MKGSKRLWQNMFTKKWPEIGSPGLFEIVPFNRNKIGCLIRAWIRFVFNGFGSKVRQWKEQDFLLSRTERKAFLTEATKESTG